MPQASCMRLWTLERLRADCVRVQEFRDTAPEYHYAKCASACGKFCSAAPTGSLRTIIIIAKASAFMLPQRGLSGTACASEPGRNSHSDEPTRPNGG
jgi:hypothetical protein